MGREEQAEEREVLESIFPDELTVVSDSELRIAIQLDLPDVVVRQIAAEHAAAAAAAEDNDGDGDEDEPPIMLLTVRYPEDYPDVAPELDLSAPPQQQSSTVTSRAAAALFHVADDKAALLEGLQETVQENLGMAMVFALVSALKEAAEQLMVERQAAVDKKREEAAMAAERVENQKFHGTSVTPESFQRWRDAFVAEMAAARQRSEDERLAELAKRGGNKALANAAPKLTGRQLWERGLAGKVEDDDDAAAEDEAEGLPTSEVQKLKITA